MAENQRHWILDRQSYLLAIKKVTPPLFPTTTLHHTKKGEEGSEFSHKNGRVGKSFCLSLIYIAHLYVSLIYIAHLYLSLIYIGHLYLSLISITHLYLYLCMYVCVFCLFTTLLLFVIHRKNLLLQHLINRYITFTSR